MIAAAAAGNSCALQPGGGVPSRLLGAALMPSKDQPVERATAMLRHPSPGVLLTLIVAQHCRSHVASVREAPSSTAAIAGNRRACASSFAFESLTPPAENAITSNRVAT